MSHLRISEPARQDLQSIWTDISADSLGAADRIIDSIVHRFELLAEFPEMGRARPELASGLRSFPVGNYLIFYQLTAGWVEVVRVLHGARDLPSILVITDEDPSS